MHNAMRYVFSVFLVSLSSATFSADRPDIGALAANELLASGREAVARADWKKAQVNLREAVREDPNNADAHNLLAYTYRKQNEPDLVKAFEHYKLALSIDPKHRSAHEYIGEAYLMAGQLKKAQEHLMALETVCGNRQCEEYKDLAQAIAAFQEKTPGKQ
jgi:tetratricopeptide (TPR) repeat protein